MTIPDCRHLGKRISEHKIECFSDHFQGPDYAIRTVQFCSERCPFTDKPQLKEMYPHLFGFRERPGTELSLMLARLKSFCVLDSCDCRKHAARMDAWGSDGCRNNLQTIIEWLRESAKKCKLPFSEFVARRIVNMAIRRSVRKAEKARRKHGKA